MQPDGKHESSGVSRTKRLNTATTAHWYSNNIGLRLPVSQKRLGQKLLRVSQSEHASTAVVPQTSSSMIVLNRRRYRRTLRTLFGVRQYEALRYATATTNRFTVRPQKLNRRAGCAVSDCHQRFFFFPKTPTHRARLARTRRTS